MLSGVLFDLDGTLLDTVEDFMAVIDSMLDEHQRPRVAPELIRAQVSDGSIGMLSVAFATRPGEPGFDALRDEFLTRYERALAVHTRPFPGIMPLLDWLDTEGLPWGVVTNKLSRFSIPLMEQIGLSERCGSLVCPDQVSQGKPHPEAIFKACAELSISPQHCVFVGDHLRDIQAGRAAGMDTIAALYGYLPAEEDHTAWQATHSVYTATDLQPWLLGRRNLETIDV
ncbi:phosphoglycolate phosphatase [Halopseudomonas oceani]|uniref:Phosphoglycolate phosphatase n=1 Tax=Halopseudomonas oceani TaxID=1708783 RepID=A0A2P4EVE6_9GAMM|nr:HAD-IA family hydrolase [Halopseudomonas oceani]POB03538.1 phosphoglycolate phosphatase [Halopseudomonas oceani]GGE45835.1 phosphoglycolate phosphatase [Halopseudomonas oceani]